MRQLLIVALTVRHPDDTQMYDAASTIMQQKIVPGEGVGRCLSERILPAVRVI